MTLNIVGLPGDGIGPEVFAAMQKVVAATGVTVAWHMSDLAGKNGLLNPEAVSLITQHKLAIKGPTGTPFGEGHRSYNVQMREAFQLFANVRPVQTLPGISKPGMRDDVDLVIFRENLEDLYVGRENEIQDGYAAWAPITRSGTVRIAKYARHYMRGHGRRKITIGAKSNVIKLSHGLFADTATEVLRGLDLDVSHTLPDALACQLVQYPEAFDGILLPNFLGDIFSDMCAAFMGGLGVAPGANIGNDVAVFEAVHGTAPDIAGKGLANPTALILSAAMMFDHAGEQSAAAKIRSAINAVYTAGKQLTGDMVGKDGVSTKVFTGAVCAAIS